MYVASGTVILYRASTASLAHALTVKYHTENRHSGRRYYLQYLLIIFRQSINSSEVILWGLEVVPTFWYSRWIQSTLSSAAGYTRYTEIWTKKVHIQWSLAANTLKADNFYTVDKQRVLKYLKSGYLSTSLYKNVTVYRKTRHMGSAR